MTDLLDFMKSQQDKQHEAKSIAQLRADALYILFITEGHESLLSAAENLVHVRAACPEAFEGHAKLSTLHQRMDASLKRLLLTTASVTVSVCMQSAEKLETRLSGLEQRLTEVTRSRRVKHD